MATVRSGRTGNCYFFANLEATRLLRRDAVFLWITFVLAALSAAEANSARAVFAAFASPDSTAAKTFFRSVRMRLLTVWL